ncbi:unnamed protein product [Lathyrus sativus]|nr:unnamed protein product [Lathyrus sativus]
MTKHNFRERKRREEQEIVTYGLSVFGHWNNSSKNKCNSIGNLHINFYSQDRLFLFVVSISWFGSYMDKEEVLELGGGDHEGFGRQRPSYVHEVEALMRWGNYDPERLPYLSCLRY